MASPDKTPLREELFDCPRLRCGETKSRLWDRAENAEAEVVRLRQERDSLHTTWKATERELAEERAVVERLREALREFVPESPWDIDQECRYCRGVYDWHEEDCVWVKAAALVASPDKPPDPDHFEGNLGANIAGGRYPDKG